MFFKSSTYLSSYVKFKDCPETGLPEFAFAGRSNVGKTSLINYLTNTRKLAKVSQTPGKTQMLNYFVIDDSWYLVDLPGYGYAKVSKSQRSDFGKLVNTYVANREQLYCLFLLIDSRIPPQKIDLEFISFLGKNQVPFVIVFTKADKYPARAVKENIEAFKTEMLKTWEALPEIFVTSTAKKIGVEDILTFIRKVLQEA